MVVLYCKHRVHWIINLHAVADHPSLLNVESGSWFIQELLQMFESYEQMQHVADMITVLHQRLQERVDGIRADKKNVKTLQKPCTWSSLSKRFYLHCS